MATNYEQISMVIREEGKRQEVLKEQGKFPNTCADIIPDTERLAYLAEEFGEVAREVAEIVQLETLIARIGGGAAAQLNASEPVDFDGMIAQATPLERQISERKNKLAKELVQVAAICVAWLEGLDKEDERG